LDSYEVFKFKFQNHVEWYEFDEREQCHELIQALKGTALSSITSMPKGDRMKVDKMWEVLDRNHLPDNYVGAMLARFHKMRKPKGKRMVQYHQSLMEVYTRCYPTVPIEMKNVAVKTRMLLGMSDAERRIISTHVDEANGEKIARKFDNIIQEFDAMGLNIEDNRDDRVVEKIMSALDKRVATPTVSQVAEVSTLSGPPMSLRGAEVEEAEYARKEDQVVERIMSLLETPVKTQKIGLERHTHECTGECGSLMYTSGEYRGEKTASRGGQSGSYRGGYKPSGDSYTEKKPTVGYERQESQGGSGRGGYQPRGRGSYGSYDRGSGDRPSPVVCWYCGRPGHTPEGPGGCYRMRDDIRSGIYVPSESSGYQDRGGSRGGYSGRGGRGGYREGGYREGGYRDGGYREGGYRSGGYREGGYDSNRAGNERDENGNLVKCPYCGKLGHTPESPGGCFKKKDDDRFAKQRETERGEMVTNLKENGLTPTKGGKS